MKHKKFLIGSIILFVMGCVALMVSLMMVYDLAGSTLGSEPVANADARINQAIVVNRSGMGAIIVAGVLMVIWVVRVTRRQPKANDK